MQFGVSLLSPIRTPNYASSYYSIATFGIHEFGVYIRISPCHLHLQLHMHLHSYHKLSAALAPAYTPHPACCKCTGNQATRCLLHLQQHTRPTLSASHSPACTPDHQLHLHQLELQALSGPPAPAYTPHPVCCTSIGMHIAQLFWRFPFFFFEDVECFTGTMQDCRARGIK